MNENMSASIVNLAMALSKFQLEIENVDKDVQAYGYKYANLASCLEAIKKPLAKNGLSVIQPIQLIGDKHVLETYIFHETGEWIKSSFCIENVAVKGTNSIQQLGAGITYARRYALCAIVGLTQEDTDGVVEKKQDNSKNFTVKKAEQPQQVSVVTQLLNLCKENRIDAKDFTAHYKISSQDIAAVTNVVEKFEEMAALYMQAKQNAVLTKTDALIQEMAGV